MKDIHNGYLVQKMDLKVGIKYFVIYKAMFVDVFSCLARDINVQKGNIAWKLLKF